MKFSDDKWQKKKLSSLLAENHHAKQSQIAPRKKNIYSDHHFGIAASSLNYFLSKFRLDLLVVWISSSEESREIAGAPQP